MIMFHMQLIWEPCDNLFLLSNFLTFFIASVEYVFSGAVDLKPVIRNKILDFGGP